MVLVEAGVWGSGDRIQVRMGTRRDTSPQEIRPSVQPGDVEALTRQLRIVLDEPAVASRLGRAGSQRAEEFSQDTILPEIERHIAALSLS